MERWRNGKYRSTPQRFDSSIARFLAFHSSYKTNNRFLKNLPCFPQRKRGDEWDLPNFQVLPPDLPIFAVVPPRTKPVVFISPPKEKLWALRQRGEWNSWARNRCRGTEINQKEKVRVGAYCIVLRVLFVVLFIFSQLREVKRLDMRVVIHVGLGVVESIWKEKRGWGRP